MSILYEQNVSKFSSKTQKEKLVGSKRTHEESDDSSISGDQNKYKRFNLTNPNAVEKLNSNFASNKDILNKPDETFPSIEYITSET